MVCVHVVNVNNASSPLSAAEIISALRRTCWLHVLSQVSPDSPVKAEVKKVHKLCSKVHHQDEEDIIGALVALVEVSSDRRQARTRRSMKLHGLIVCCRKSRNEESLGHVQPGRPKSFLTFMMIGCLLNFVIFTHA